MSKHSAFISRAAPGDPQAPSAPRSRARRAGPQTAPPKGKLMTGRSKSLPEIVLFCPSTQELIPLSLKICPNQYAKAKSKKDML